MESRADPDFWKAYRALPADVQRQADSAYRRWLRDPFYPGLQFKHLADDVWSVRVGLKWRALGTRIDDQRIVWFWIGSHADYDKMI